MNKLSFTKGVCAVALGAVLALGTLPATAFAVATETGPDPDQWNSDTYYPEGVFDENATIEEKFGVPMDYKPVEYKRAEREVTFDHDETIWDRYLVDDSYTVITINPGVTVNMVHGITVDKDAHLNITGGGTLNVNGLSHGGSDWNGYAGIGADPYKVIPGDIHFDNVTVYAEGGPFAAGIGGTAYAKSGEITIWSDANVTAIGGTHAAGIGGGWCGEAGPIDIKGTVNAKGGFHAVDSYDCSEKTNAEYNAPAIGSGNFFHSMIGRDVYDIKLEEGSNVTVQQPNHRLVDAFGAGFNAHFGKLANNTNVDVVK